MIDDTPILDGCGILHHGKGIKFHLYGTLLSGLAVDDYAVADSTVKAVFSDVLIGTGYTLEKLNTAICYVVPEQQTVAVEWNTVTNKSVTNILKSGTSPSLRAMPKRTRPFHWQAQASSSTARMGRSSRRHTFIPKST